MIGEKFKMNEREQELYEKIMNDVSLVYVTRPIYTMNDEEKYRYCRDIYDSGHAWGTIIDDFWKVAYCQDVKDREEVWSYIHDDVHLVSYCRTVKDRPELWKRLSSDEGKQDYCKYVTYREEVASLIKDPKYKITKEE